jgi:hypothetical protein
MKYKMKLIALALVFAVGTILSVDVHAQSKRKAKGKRAASSDVQETGRDGCFIAYDNGTVLDIRTDLMWAAKDSGEDITWSNAKSYCENYRGGGYTDWRMPKQDELAGLFDAAKTYKSDCGYEVHLTELIRITCNSPWALEMDGSYFATFFFNLGKFGWRGLSWKLQSRALPVRSGKFSTPERTSDAMKASGIAPVKKNLLTLDSWSYSVIQGSGFPSYSEAYQITVNLKNGFDKGIKLLDVSVRFYDLLNTLIYAVKLGPDLHLPALQVTETTGVYKINQFMMEHQRMKAMNKSDIKATLDVQKIVFDDNTILEFSK